MNSLTLRSIVLPAVGIVLTSSTVLLEQKQNPEFTIEEVRRHDGTNGKPIYVTFRGGVHDISKFKDVHPGGNYILQAAGGDVEGFWEVWAYHFLSKKVKEALADTKIGTLKDNEKDVNMSCTSVDPYGDEPIRNDKAVKILTEKPYCSETLPSVLNKGYFTENDTLYVRNHAPVPVYLSAGTHNVAFHSTRGDDRFMTNLAVHDLYSRFQMRHVVSVIQCAGNRASEDLVATGPSGFTGTPFEQIESGMVGNVKWTGVWLREVLMHQYPEICRTTSAAREQLSEWHVVFNGADGYEASVPLDILLDTKNDCMLVTHMNGQELTPDHGYPLRVVLPGIAGARSVKWLESATLSKIPSDAPWNSYYYKHSDGSHIYYLPLQSIILSPTKNELVARTSANTVHVSGVTYSAGDASARISDVEVSADDGQTWTTARLMNEELVGDDAHSFHGWVRFEVDIAIPDVDISSSSNGAFQNIRICSRARDASGNIQPQISVKQRGYLYNGWNVIDCKVASRFPSVS